MKTLIAALTAVFALVATFMSAPQFTLAQEKSAGHPVAQKRSDNPPPVSGRKVTVAVVAENETMKSSLDEPTDVDRWLQRFCINGEEGRAELGRYDLTLHQCVPNPPPS